jgi:hypothetical protein
MLYGATPWEGLLAFPPLPTSMLGTMGDSTVLSLIVLNTYTHSKQN